MTRKILTTAAAAVALGTVPVVAAPAGAAAVADAPTVICDNYGLQAGLATKVCATVSGDSIEFSGHIGLAGPPSPGSPLPRPTEVEAVLTGSVAGGITLGTTRQTLTFQSRSVLVEGVRGTVPCGSTVRASFAVSSAGWPARPVTTEVPVTC
ncbi:hypothetical protein OG618_06065 [Kitasatospora sp. NBC_01246]|uniref:hypothetical protein n=1 Tax=Kitasatospora sp. NBC_01246 TaxID=2903570 RepID=UPI002E3313F0|nr:hypothetical protein [Kitasatospora sp. NBC_01246]